jgi:predicted dehydrogenase
MERRQFIQQVAGTALVSATALSGPRILGANDRVNVGLIGCGGRGRADADLLRQVSDVKVVAVCDVYEPHAEAAKVWAGSGCRSYGDFRRLLEQRDVDAVLVATPDHWHAAITVLACQGGKDVYVEKPLGHTIREGRKIVEAARRYNRVVQTGTQHRSAPHFRQAAEIVQSGQIGPVHFVRVWNYLNMSPDGIGRVADSAPFPGLDWDFYLGPAPRVPFNKNRFLVSYRWFWDYAGGMATDYGTHRLDSVHQVMGVDAPRSATAAGGRVELSDGAETPDVLQSTYDYPGFVLSYEASMLNDHGCGGRRPGKKYYLTRSADDRPHGMAFYGSKGSLFADRVGFEVYPEPRGENGPGAANASGGTVKGFRAELVEVAGEDATGLHLKNFIECVRTRQKPVADVEIGHRSTIVPHLGNIAFRTGRKIRWDAEREEIMDDPKASEFLDRPARKPWNLIQAT